MKVALTDALIQRHCAAKQRIELWDTLVPNFLVQVRASGHAAFFIRYTSPVTGKRCALKLGDAAVWNTDKARQLARQKLAWVDQGQDPARDGEAPKASPTLQAIVLERYLPHVQATKKSWDTDETLLRCHILPALGARPIGEIRREDVSALLNAMRHGGKLAGIKGRSREKRTRGRDYAPGTCNRVRVLLRYLFNLAMKQWKVPGLTHNPVGDLPDFPVTPRQTFLQPDEIERLLEAGRPRPGMQNPHTLFIVMLLTLTGVRRANALQAEWSEFDLARGLWTLPAEKTKQKRPQTIHLAQEVLTLLQQLPTWGTQERFVFPNPKTGKPFKSIFYSWDTMRKGAGLPHVRLHDLRHTFASLLINGGASLFLVQAALGHRNPQTTMRYAHLAETTQREAIQAAAARIACQPFFATPPQNPAGPG